MFGCTGLVCVDWPHNFIYKIWNKMQSKSGYLKTVVWWCWCKEGLRNQNTPVTKKASLRGLRSFHRAWEAPGPGDPSCTDETAPPTSYRRDNQNKPATNQLTKMKLTVNIKRRCCLLLLVYIPLLLTDELVYILISWLGVIIFSSKQTMNVFL